MDAKRWSPLVTFALGCLSGAVVIGWRLVDAGNSAPNNPHGVVSDGDHMERLDERDVVVPPAVSSSEVTKTAPIARVEAEVKEETPTETGKSVADVLAHLEDEYRQRNAPAPAAEPPASARALTPAPSSTAEVARANPNEAAPQVAQGQPASVPITAKLAATESVPVGVAVSPVARASSAAAPVEEKPAAPAAQEVAALLESMRDAQASSLSEGGEQRIAAQLKQVTALQQAALVQQAALAQQFALLQYLQLFALSSNSKTTSPTQTQRRPFNGRIVDTLPSSISATDNPWGFKFQEPTLVH